MAYMINRLIAIAPMLDWTDRHARYFLRLISKHVLLYTEMVTTGALLHGDVARHLHYSPAAHPLALQLGGSVPQELAVCAKLAQDYGYDEVNLNIGCPSDRVQSGRFGACLMAHPQLVADCVQAMRETVRIPITVKTRIGIDQQDSYEELQHFVETVAKAGCEVFIIHARKAWLHGLSPKENREIPPLRYEVVHTLKQDFSGLQIILNGGLTSCEAIRQQLEYVDGVMVGRAAYHNPYLLAQIEQQFFGETSLPNREEILACYSQYIEEQLSQGVPLSAMTRHILGLYQSLPGARAWRRFITEESHKKGKGAEILLQSVAL